MVGIILAIIVALIWSFGEIFYSSVSKKYDNTNVYLYTYFIRTIVYLLVVLFFKNSLFGTFDFDVFFTVLPIILCDLFASLVINIAVFNGKLSVVSPIMSSYPVLNVLFGMILLKEKVNSLQILLSLIISISIVVLAFNQKASDKAPNPIKGIIFSIFYMILIALSTFFEKSIYLNNISLFDLYYYKGIIYGITSLFFLVFILSTSIKLKRPSIDILKGCGLTPLGNVFYSFALFMGSMTIVSPISSLYSVFTNFFSRIYLREKIRFEEKLWIYLIIISTLVLVILEI